MAFNDEIERIKQGIKNGDPEAMFALGMIYADRAWDSAEFRDEALSWFWVAANEGGNTDAMIQLGLAYNDGGIASTDYQKARYYYQMALDKGDYRAASSLACFYTYDDRGVEQDFVKALELALLGAEHAKENNNPDAIIYAANYYLLGIGTEKNLSEALKWLELAEEMGADVSEELKSVFYDKDSAVQLDPIALFQFHKKTAKAGDSHAQYMLSEDYFHGLGCEVDYQQADHWLHLAADQGDWDAMSSLGIQYLLEETYDKALQYLEPLINWNMQAFNPDFLRDIARLYMGGTDGVAEDLEEACVLYQYVADTTGDASALTVTGALLLQQNPPQYEQAIKYYTLAVEAGDPDAPKLLNQLKDYLSQLEQVQAQEMSDSEGCYIATAVYGSYDCPEVWTLRRYRDQSLAQTWYGRAFIRIYYALSPTLVKWFGNNTLFKRIWQRKLDRMVQRLQAEGFENTAYKDIDYGHGSRY